MGIMIISYYYHQQYLWTQNPQTLHPCTFIYHKTIGTPKSTEASAFYGDIPTLLAFSIKGGLYGISLSLFLLTCLFGALSHAPSPQPSTPRFQPHTLNSKPSILRSLNPQPWTLELQPYALNPRTSTLNSKIDKLLIVPLTEPLKATLKEHLKEPLKGNL